jgi:hypothetical protein
VAEVGVPVRSIAHQRSGSVDDRKGALSRSLVGILSFDDSQHVVRLGLQLKGQAATRLPWYSQREGDVDQTICKLLYLGCALDKVTVVLTVDNMASKEAMDSLVFVQRLGVKDRRGHDFEQWPEKASHP